MLNKFNSHIRNNQFGPKSIEDVKKDMQKAKSFKINEQKNSNLNVNNQPQNNLEIKNKIDNMNNLRRGLWK